MPLTVNPALMILKILKHFSNFCQVQGVFFATLLFYVVVIPGFLLYLFVKQHIVLQRNKLFMNCAKPKMEGREFHFEQIPSERNQQFAELQEPRVLWDHLEYVEVIRIHFLKSSCIVWSWICLGWPRLVWGFFRNLAVRNYFFLIIVEFYWRLM